MSTRTLEVKHADSGDFSDERIAWDIIKATGWHQTIVPPTIDLRSAKHLKPYAVACLACLALRGGPQVQLLPPEDGDCREHLERMGFFQLVGHESSRVASRPTNIPLRHLRDTEKPGNFPYVAASVLSKEMPDIPTELQANIGESLFEVIANACVHAESPIGCVVAGQAFPKKDRVEVCCVDLGQTIMGHLRKNPAYLGVDTHAAAILKAVESGVTGTVGRNRWNEPNSGAGLADLREHCESGGGELTILSGDTYIVFRHGMPPLHVPLYKPFHGCLVNVRFFCA